MTTKNPPSITFAALAGAYSSRRISEEVFLILCALVEDLPPWWKLRTETNRRAPES